MVDLNNTGSINNGGAGTSSELGKALASRLSPIEAARKFIHCHFPNCHAAILAGSVIRGEATETSDLDIVIFDKHVDRSYRESLIYLDWPIEVFVHNLSSYKQFFNSDYKRARPSLQRMVSEGIVIKDSDIIGLIKQEANEILSKGPEQWSEETITMKRYFITDALDDFIGCTDRFEAIFIANTLAELVHEFVLRTNRQWTGTSKWIVRSLNHFDKSFTKEYVEAFDLFYQTNNKEKIITLVESVLLPSGGRLFSGFTLGKNK
ncbi:nucleotidyltransferase domain-containing protein [Cytobacillus sp. IB215316]|uniref:nucleotidyltransferase domain-containing protein n=1 Tax=Cytobacillus sp. IB215316 TaxID=3097354 RepID=UPI002A12ED13|nr:nucleotidyltransferase domain-containing protein [Cytobacillus sp. IB215316]MDX8361435.1 nucleotidyltransferase domain-containing protein [Cytobacillus sp. IB215316]